MNQATPTTTTTTTTTTPTPRAKHLLIGLDGAGLDIVRAFGAERLPNLHALLQRGACAPLRSVQPPATLPDWATLLTGENPGVHGVFDFTTRTGYRVHFTAGSVRMAPTIAARLDAAGQSCACLFFPGTYPPERLERGVFISGWDAPVAFEADRSFVWPHALHDEIVARFGPQRFDDVDEFDADAPGWHARLPDALCSRIARRSELAKWLLEKRDWDLFAVYFGESDTASHHLWSLHDERSPRHPGRESQRVSQQDREGLMRVYAALDRAVGTLIEHAGGEQVEVTIVSDHGSGGASDKVLYLNRVLEGAGLLGWKPRSALPRLIGRAKDLALTRLPPKVRETLFRGFGALLPGLLESRARFAAIDMSHTHVFSDELNYFPALHYNLVGREPNGTVDPRDVPALRKRIEDVLYALRDPWTGERVVTKVYAREELYAGPYIERAPDLLLELALDRGYSYNLMPSSATLHETRGETRARPFANAELCFRQLKRGEYLGRKGRSLPGSHRPNGLFIAAGPSIAAVGEIQAEMADVTATLLARMHMALPSSFRGRVLTSAPRNVPETSLAGSVPEAVSTSAKAQMAADARTELTVSQPEAPTGTESARVEARLRRLGYIE